MNVTVHLNNLGVTGEIWVGGEAGGVRHFWGQSGTIINALMWPGGVEDSNTSSGNKKVLVFPGNSNASSVSHLEIKYEGNPYQALCEETPCP